MRTTIELLAAKASGLNITLHLRETVRNQFAAGAWLRNQAAFAASICPGHVPPCLQIAPSLAYGADIQLVKEVLASRASSMLLLSAPWPSPVHCVRCAEGAALTTFDDKGKERLQQFLEVAAADNAIVVLDAIPTADGAAGRVAELADAALLDFQLGSKQLAGPSITI